MLINLTNHPSEKWQTEQKEAAIMLYGNIIDVPFPVVPPETSEDDVASLAEQTVQKVISISNGQSVTVHVMGEMTLTYSLVKRLQQNGICCVASTTERTVQQVGNQKISVFKFIKFREYER